MNEGLKTVSFVVVAVLIVGIAWLTKPTLPVPDAEDVRGQRLFPDFNDELKAASLEIVEFDEETATVRPFRVAQVDVKGEGKTRWSIPSHENYPADARDQVADAAASLMGLKVLEVAGSGPGDHELYGVVDPDPNKRKGTTGVGTRVAMQDKSGKELLSLIIGKEVPGRSELRYVRKVDQDPVYSVKVSTSKLSAKFEDWIEEDLLKLNAWDIKQIQIKDYSVDELQGAITHRGDMLLSYDDTGQQKWKLTEDLVLKQVGQQLEWVPQEMADDEELDTKKLDDMKSALDNLEIIDVSRKPPGLSGDLKASKSFYEDPQARNSLGNRGFYVVPVGTDRYELFSNEGEIRCTMEDGVEYVLRFGEIAGGSTPSGKKDGDEEDSSGFGMNRYIFVMAEFNEDIIPEPELEELPQEEEKPADEETPKSEAPEQPKAADQSPEKKAAEESPEKEAAGESPGQETDENSTIEKTEDAEADDQADIEAERERIEKENKRKQEEYQEKKEEGNKKVEELNKRFADWYYIISDKVYQEIHLSRDQIVKKKEKKEEEKDKEDKGDEADADAGKKGGQQEVDQSGDDDQGEKLQQEEAGMPEESKESGQESPAGN